MRTVLRETLNDGTDNHGQGTEADRPSTAKPIVDDGNQGKRENGTERVGCADNALEGSFGFTEICEQTGLATTTLHKTTPHPGGQTESPSNLQSSHGFKIWRALIIWESNPDVNSMPIHVGKSMK